MTMVGWQGVKGTEENHVQYQCPCPTVGTQQMVAAIAAIVRKEKKIT